MSVLPDYDVIIWLYYNEIGKNLEKDILSIVDIEPYDRNEYDGFLIYIGVLKRGMML